MRRMLVLWAVVPLFWALPQPASADPLVLRYFASTSAGAQVGGSFEEDLDSSARDLTSQSSMIVGDSSAVAQATFINALAPDFQSLFLSGLAVSSVTAPTGSAVAYAQGAAALHFVLDQPYTYSFSGSFIGLGGFNVLEASLVDVSDPSSSAIFNYRELSSTALSSTGTLLPGLYDFFLVGRATAGCGFGAVPECTSEEARNFFNFEFQLSPQEPAPVPEPATMILLGSGLVGVFAARRRQRSAKA